MKFQEAKERMEARIHVYRPTWPDGATMIIESGEFTRYRYGGIPMRVELPLADIDATDWEVARD